MGWLVVLLREFGAGIQRSGWAQLLLVLGVIAVVVAAIDFQQAPGGQSKGWLFAAFALLLLAVGAWMAIQAGVSP